VRRAMGASAASGRCCLRVPLRHRRRWRCLVLAVVAALLTAILYDQFVLARRSGSRLLPLFLLGLSCPAPVAVRANMSLLDTRHAELAAIAEQNSLLEQLLRARDGGAAILFLHFHKAGGTSFCAAAGANGERTAINQGGQSVVIDDPGLNCNVCYRDQFAWSSAQVPFGRYDCPYEDYSLSGTDREQRSGFQRLVADARGPRLSLVGIETPVRSLSPSFLSGSDRPWVYATAVRDPYDALLSEFNMKCPAARRHHEQPQQQEEGTVAPGVLARADICDAAGDSIFAYARIKASLPGNNHLTGGLIEGLTGIPRTIQRAEQLDDGGSSSSPNGDAPDHHRDRFCWEGIHGYKMKPCGAERLLQALHQPHSHTAASLSSMSRAARLRLIVGEAKWRLEHFSLVVVTDGGFGAGLAVAAAKFGWQQTNECALRRGTHSGAAMRDTAEYQSNAEFRAWLEERFGADLEVFEYAKAIARRQFDALRSGDASGASSDPNVDSK
jgi:hypothetical protein